jgi:hypothetical protein
MRRRPVTTIEWRRGMWILRSASWPPLLVSVSAAAILICIAALAHRTGLAVPTTQLGLAAGGAAAAHSLDEAATSVADASPTSRRHRTAWRLPLIALPTTVAWCGLFTLSRLEPETQWLRLLPLGAGAIGIGIALAAVLRHRGTDVPGDLAGVVTLVGVVLIVSIDPLRLWVELVPLGDASHPGRSATAWIAIVGVCAAITLACTRDPGRRGRAGHRRQS